MKYRRLAAALAVYSTLMLSGCGDDSIQLLDSYSDHLDEMMTCQNDLFKLEGLADGRCVIEPDNSFSPDDLEAPAGGLFDITNQETLYCKNASEPRTIAGLTKLMTAFTALKHGDITQTVIIENQQSTPDGILVCGFEDGDQVQMTNLLSAVLIYSGNDAALNIASAVAGSESEFTDLMNQDAAQINTSHTHFSNATGLKAQKQYSSVYDIYLIFNECLKYDKFRDIIKRNSFVCYYTNAAGENITKDFNTSVRYLTGAASPPEGIEIIGAKDSYSSFNGHSLVVLARDRHDKEYIGIICGAASKDSLYEQMNGLLQKIG